MGHAQTVLSGVIHVQPLLFLSRWRFLGPFSKFFFPYQILFFSQDRQTYVFGQNFPEDIREILTMTRLNFNGNWQQKTVIIRARIRSR